MCVSLDKEVNQDLLPVSFFANRFTSDENAIVIMQMQASAM